jgi:hypothetical protein
VSAPLGEDPPPAQEPRGDAHLGVPLEGGHSDAFVRERASATPRQHVASAREEHTTPRAHATAHLPSIRAPAIAAPLRALQHWFAAAVMHPAGVTAGVEAMAARGAVAPGALAPPLAEIERVLAPSRALAGIDRLAIYGDAYRARLVECLADDYPALQYALGGDTFEALCLRYIARHPSTSPNLNSFGRHMAAFCRTAEYPPLAFGGDLAALEWAMVEVLHALSSEKLDLATLATVPADRWGAARFAPSRAVRVMEFAFPANAFFQAFRSDEGPALPSAAWSATAVFRDGATIWRMDLSRAMHGLLTALSGGTPLGLALDALAEAGQISDEEGAQVMVWFRDWVRHGFFARIETG